MWRSIETAPKDGTRILLGRFTAGNTKEEREHNGFMAVNWYRRTKDGTGFNGFGRFNTMFWPATHWMPLPEPPASSAINEG